MSYAYLCHSVAGEREKERVTSTGDVDFGGFSELKLKVKSG